MRLTSDFWVSALVKRVFAAGGFAAVAQRGASEAGSIFLLVRDRSGRARLFGPAAQASYAVSRPSERQFSLLADADEEAISERLDRERRFDPDFWVVDIELPDINDAQAYFTVASD